MTHLALVPDPRDRRGLRHRLASILAVAVCACAPSRPAATAGGRVWKVAAVFVKRRAIDGCASGRKAAAAGIARAYLAGGGE
nr:transposase family protein [Plantactinospora mayteni]